MRASHSKVLVITPIFTVIAEMNPLNYSCECEKNTCVTIELAMTDKEHINRRIVCINNTTLSSGYIIRW